MGRWRADRHVVADLATLTLIAALSAQEPPQMTLPRPPTALDPVEFVVEKLGDARHFLDHDDVYDVVGAMTVEERMRLRQAQPRLRADLQKLLRSFKPGARPWVECKFANILIQGGLYDLAREQLNAFVDHAPPGPPADMVNTCEATLLLADLELARGNGGRAEALAKQVLRWAQGSNADAIVYRSYAEGVLGRVAIESGDSLAARRHIAEQKALAKASGDAVARLRSAVYEAELLLGEDRGEAALRALTEYGTGTDPRIEVIGGVAQFALSRVGAMDSGKAKLTLERALAMTAQQAGYAMRAHLCLLELALQDGDVHRAARELEQARGLRDVVTTRGATSPMSAELESLSAWYLRVRQREGGVTTRELQDQRQRLEIAFAGLIESFRRFPDDGGHAFLSFHYRRRVVGELIEYLCLLDPEHAEERAADLLLETESLSTANHDAGIDRTDVGRLRETVLGENDGIVLFSMAPEVSHLVLITRDRCRLHRLPGWWALREDIHESKRQLDQVASSFFDEEKTLHVLRRLRAALLPSDVVSSLRQCDVVTFADLGTLYGLPWEGFVLDDDSLLGEVVAVNNFSSLALAADRAARAPAPTREPSLDFIATLGAEGGADESLPIEMLDEVRRLYGNERDLLGEDATVEAVEHREPSTVMQIIAHGVCSEDATIRGALELADGTLQPADVAAMAPRAQVVILSSCRSGRPKQALGEDPAFTTLGGEFLRAGVPTVVQSRCDLAFRAHVRLLREFHRQLVAGETVASALRNARRLQSDRSLAERLQHAQVQVFGFGYRQPIEGD